MMSPGLEKRATQDLEAGKVTRTPCKSKGEVLGRIERGEADAMSVIPPSFHMGEVAPNMSHYAIRFKDRVLGEKVRRHSIEGFGLKDKCDARA